GTKTETGTAPASRPARPRIDCAVGAGTGAVPVSVLVPHVVWAQAQRCAARRVLCGPRQAAAHTACSGAIGRAGFARSKCGALVPSGDRRGGQSESRDPPDRGVDHGPGPRLSAVPRRVAEADPRSRSHGAAQCGARFGGLWRRRGARRTGGHAAAFSGARGRGRTPPLPAEVGGLRESGNPAGARRGWRGAVAAPGEVRTLRHKEGDVVAPGDALAELSADQNHVWEALRALLVVGKTDDLDDVRRFTQPVPGLPEKMARQAALTVRAIQARGK